MKRLPIAIACVVGLAGAGPALAWHDDYYSHDRDGARYDYARVIEVEPIYDRATRPVDREVCYDQPVERYEPRYTTYHDRSGPTVLGALIGGALGNTVGHGDGRKAATIAGAVIGGSIAHNNSRGRDVTYDSGGEVYRDYETRCRTETNWERGGREIVGYNVTYRYQGRTYTTELDHDPGQRLRVNVDSRVTPAE